MRRGRTVERIGMIGTGVLAVSGLAATSLASPTLYAQSHHVEFQFNLRNDAGFEPWELGAVIGTWNTKQVGRAYRGGHDQNSDPTNSCNYVLSRSDGPAYNFSGAAGPNCFLADGDVYPAGWNNTSNAPRVISSSSASTYPGHLYAWFHGVHGGPALVTYGPSSHSLSLVAGSGVDWMTPVGELPCSFLNCFYGDNNCSYAVDWSEGSVTSSETFTIAFHGSGGLPRNLTLDLTFRASLNVQTSVTDILTRFLNLCCAENCPCVQKATCVGTPAAYNISTTQLVYVDVHSLVSDPASCGPMLGPRLSRTTYSGGLSTGTGSFGGSGVFSGINCDGGCVGNQTHTVDLCDGNGQTPVGRSYNASPYIETPQSQTFNHTDPFVIRITNTITSKKIGWSSTAPAPGGGG